MTYSLLPLNRASFIPQVRRWLLFLLLAVLGWALFIGVSTAQHVLSGAFTWEDALQMTLHQWLPWALLSPFIIWFTARFPIERNGWWLRIPLHLGACILFVAACGLLSDYLVKPPPPPWGGQGPMSPARQPGEGRPDPGPGRPSRGGGPHGHPGWSRVQFSVPTYLIIVSLSHTVVYFRRAQHRGRRALELEAHLAQARVQTLRMQLHPHFLFNTLNAISTLVHTDPRAADEMIGGLSEMLRFSLDSAAEPEVPLRRELDFLNHYLQIQQVRFGPRLRVEQNISPEVEQALIPTLMLQPLVENSIRHGIEPKLAPGVIGLRATRVGDVLRLSIRDTGVGFPDRTAPGNAAPKGIGIANTRARLQSLYPGRHRFELRNDPAGGAVVELEIPFHTAAKPAAPPGPA